MKSHLNLLFKCISIHAKKSQIILVNNRKSDYAYGFIDLQDHDAVKYVLNHLSTQPSRDNIDFDFTSIKDPLKQLKFDYKRPPKPTPSEDTNTIPPKDNKIERKFSLAQSIQNLPFSSSSASGISSSLGTMSSLPSNLVKPKHMSITTSMGGLVPNMPDKFYSLKESLGNETRTTEFKQAGFLCNERKYALQDNVGKYMCAFLNTNGGTVFVGVDDHGHVVGMTCDQHSEDKYRLSIDQAIKSINPPVLPDAYTVSFVPVLDEENSLSSHLKVIEMTMSKPKDHSNLYVYRNDAFIRRDGSVQLLRTRDVQTWERQKLVNRHDSKENVLHMLVERTQQVHCLQEQMAELQRFHENKKTRFCILL